MLDDLFFSVYNHYKNAPSKRNANDIALLYINVVFASLLALAFIFIYLFLGQTSSIRISGSTMIILFIICLVIVLFRNWIYFTGKKRTVLNASRNKVVNTKQNIWMLWILPIGLIIVSILLLQRV